MVRIAPTSFPNFGWFLSREGQNSGEKVPSARRMEGTNGRCAIADAPCAIQGETAKGVSQKGRLGSMAEERYHLTKETILFSRS